MKTNGLKMTSQTRDKIDRHITEASRRTVETAWAISRLMPNVGELTQSKRLLLTSVVRSKLLLLLTSVVRSKLLYAAPVLVTAATKIAKNRCALDRALRPTVL